MPASSLTWYRSRAKRIIKDLRLVKQKDIAIELNESPQLISYRIKNIYPSQLEDWIRILDLAGYEIREKEEEDD